MNSVYNEQVAKASIKPANTRGSIRRRLLSYIVAGVVALLLTFSVVTSWLTTKQTSAQLVENAKQVASALAQQSTLALLTASSANAESAMDQVLAFPDVDGAGLVSLDGAFYVWRGSEQTGEYFAKLSWSETTEEIIFDEDDEHWYIASAVILSDADIDDSGETIDEKLGLSLIHI